MGTIAAYKPCEFQEYRFTESPLQGGNPQIWADLGQTGQGIADPLVCTYDLPNMTPIDAVVRSTEKSHSNTGSFLLVKMCRQLRCIAINNRRLEVTQSVCHPKTKNIIDTVS